uniref:hypothetical protein n=1 Tax=Turicimonas muris TaxID=1796652 RepID=UPI003F4D722E
FQNAWEPVKRRSFSKHRITLGCLIDGKVELGRKFLRDNPQYKDVELTFTDNKLCPVGIAEVSLPVAQIVLNRSEALNAGASYVLEQIAKQSGITKALKVVFPEHDFSQRFERYSQWFERRFSAFERCHFLKSVDYLMLLNLVKVYCLKSNP